VKEIQRKGHYLMASHQELSQLCARCYQEATFEEANIEVLVQDNVFAFRGTDEPLDALRDIRIFPLWTRELGFCPAGFLKASKRLVNKVTSICLELDIDHKSIVLTGHSLGGAVAMILGALMTRDEIPPKEIVTFGAPRCGRLKILDGVPVTQYRNGKDVVPLVPPLMRRHDKLLELGRPGSSWIKDHYVINYVKMNKEPEYR
jgi:predicted lipase